MRRADGLPGLARGGAEGTPPGLAQPHGAASPAPLLGVEGCGVAEVPPAWR